MREKWGRPLARLLAFVAVGSLAFLSPSAVNAQELDEGGWWEYETERGVLTDDDWAWDDDQWDARSEDEYWTTTGDWFEYDDDQLWQDEQLGVADDDDYGTDEYGYGFDDDYSYGSRYRGYDYWTNDWYDDDYDDDWF